MLLFCFAILLALLIFLMYKIKGNEILFPSFWLLLSYFFSATASGIKSYDWNLDISLMTFLVLLISIFAFITGEFFGESVIININRCTNNNFNGFVIPGSTLYIMFGYMLVVTYINYQYIMDLAISNAYAGGIDNILTYARETILEDTDNGVQISTFLNISLKICRGIGYFMTYVLLFNNVKQNKSSILMYSISFLYFIQTILTTGRTQSTYFIIYIFLLYVLLSKTRLNWESSYNKKIFRYAFSCLLLIIVIFSFIGVVLRGSIYGTTVTVVDMLAKYIAGPLYAFDYYLENPTYSSIFGEETLYSFYGLLNKLGLDYKVGVNYLTFINIGGMNINVYGAIRRYIYDYGYISTVIIIFIMGAFYGTLFKYVKRNSSCGFSYIMYASCLYPLFFFFFEERFFQNILTINNFFVLFVIYLLYRKYRQILI